MYHITRLEDGFMILVDGDGVKSQSMTDPTIVIDNDDIDRLGHDIQQDYAAQCITLKFMKEPSYKIPWALCRRWKVRYFPLFFPI
jgi:hypothetical protein